MDTAEVPALLAAYGVTARVAGSFGDQRLPDGMVAIVGRQIQRGDRAGEDNGSSLWRRRLSARRPPGAHRRWRCRRRRGAPRRHGHVGADVAGVDVCGRRALLALDDPSSLMMSAEPMSWGRLTGRRPVAVTAMGFPPSPSERPQDPERFVAM